MTKVVNMARRFEREVLKVRRKESALDCQPTNLASSSNQPAAIQYQHDSVPTTTEQLTATATNSTTSFNLYAVTKRRRRRRRRRAASTSSQLSEVYAQTGLLKEEEDRRHHQDSANSICKDVERNVSQQMRRVVQMHQLAPIANKVNERYFVSFVAHAAHRSTRPRDKTMCKADRLYTTSPQHHHTHGYLIS